MRELWPIVADTIETLGRGALIVLVLDEAQGFLAGDANATNSSIPMKEMLGTIRKYGLMVWLLTPTARSVGPAFRNRIDDPRQAGNLTCVWRKDIGRNRRWIAATHAPGEPREWMAVMPCGSKSAMVRIQSTPWTSDLDSLPEGGYCYDHIASAAFGPGEGFDFNDFNRRMGGVASIHAIREIRAYYRENGLDSEPGPAEKEDPMESPKEWWSRKTAEALAMHDSGMEWKSVAKELGVNYNTLMSRIQRARRSDNATHQSADIARRSNECTIDVPESPRIYLSKGEARTEAETLRRTFGDKGEGEA